jgi:hypothetical protein
MAIAAGKLLNIKDKKGSAQTKPALMMMPGQGGYHKGTEPGEEQEQSQGQSGILDDLKVIHEKTVDIEKILQNTLNIQKEDIRDQRYEAKTKKRKGSENALEKAGKGAKAVGGLFKPVQKGIGVVKNFIINTVLGMISLKLLKWLPQVIKFLSIAEPVFNWIGNIAGVLLGAVVGFIDLGYKAVDTVKGVVTNIFGEGGAKAFDTFTGVFTKFANLAMILMMATSKMSQGKPPKGKGKTSKWKKKLGNKFKKTKLGKRLRNLKARKLKMMRKFTKGIKNFRKGITRGAGKFANRAMGGLNTLVKRGAKGAFQFARRGFGAAKGVAGKVAGKAAGKVGGLAAKIFGKAAKFIVPAVKGAMPAVKGFFGKIPVIGPLVVGIVSILSGEPLGKALFKTLGAALGGALGTFIPIPVLGTLIGETIGVFVGDLLYEGLMGKGWGAAGKKLLGSLMKIFSAGKAVFDWITGGFGRFWNEVPKFKIPDFPKKPPKWIPEKVGWFGIPGWVREGVWKGLRTGLKVLMGPLSLLMGKEVPNLLWLMNPFQTAPALVKSFFPPKGSGSKKAETVTPEVEEDEKAKAKKKAKKKADKKDLLIAKLKGELKEAKKIKKLNFKVERITLSGDVESVSSEASYEGGTTEIVKINKIVEKNVSSGNAGGDKSSGGSSNNGTIDNRMEAALA